MVRYGEYSPLNPTCRTSSKLLLGIGEYDERKRLLEEKKKQEYKQQVRPARKESSQIYNPENYIVPVTSKFSSKFADKSVQVECLTANEQNKLHRTCVDQCVQVTELPEVDISEDSMKDEYGNPDKCNQKRKNFSGLNHLEVDTDEKLSLNIEDSTVKNVTDFSMLSPRERRMMEFCGSGSYNPSFYEKWKSPIKTVAEKDVGTAGEQVDGHISAEQLRKRTYQDELRKQIEEKRQLEAQQREKEKREEEMILKRVEEQQLRMKLEFEREQAQRRHKVEKRLQESCKSRNEQDNYVQKSSGSNSENSTKYESSLSTKIEKMKSLPQGVTDSANFSNKCDKPFNNRLDSNNGNYLSVLEMCQTQDVTKNTGDGSKYIQNERPCWSERNCAPDGTVGDMTHVTDHLGCVKENSKQKSNRGFSEAGVKDSYQASLMKSSFDPEIPSRVNKDTMIAQRKRPVPTPRTKLHNDSVKTVTNSANTDHSQIHSTAVSTEREDLNDSLPIPVLEEAKYFNYDSSEIPGTDTVNSGALLRTEAKWKVPAVQKNIIQTGDSCRDKYHGRILTQLGAFRKQLQLDQLRMEQKVKIVKTQSDA